jgi:hypothetical protein
LVAGIHVQFLQYLDLQNRKAELIPTGRKIEYFATSITRNTGRNIGNIRGYSEVFSILNDLNIVRIVLFLRPKLSSYISATLNAPFTKLSGQIEITFSYVRAKLPAVKVTRPFLITRSFF